MLNKLMNEHVEKVNRLNYPIIEKYFNDNKLNLHSYICLSRNVFNLDCFFEDFPVTDYPYFYL